MEINSMMQANIYSIRQAIGIATMQKALNQDAAGVEMLTENMNEMSRKIMENSVSPHLGGNIDITA